MENMSFIYVMCYGQREDKDKTESKSTLHFRPSINPHPSTERILLLIYHLAPYLLLVFSNYSVNIFIILELGLGKRVNIRVRVSFIVSIRLSAV